MMDIKRTPLDEQGEKAVQARDKFNRAMAFDSAICGMMMSLADESDPEINNTVMGLLIAILDRRVELWEKVYRELFGDEGMDICKKFAEAVVGTKDDHQAKK